MAMLDFSMLGLPQFGVNPMQGDLTPVPMTQRKGGFMDRFNTAINPYGGLLGDDGDLVKQQGLLGLASGLLAASGPSTQRVSLGQALGQGLQGMQQGQQAGFSNAMKAQQMAGKLPGAGGPASVQEWQYYSNLPEADQKRYLEMKRQMYSVGDVGGVPSLRPNSPGMPVVPLSTLPNEVNAAAALEAGKTGARVEAQGRTEAALDLPKAQASADQTISLINELRNHPGRELATGTSSALPLVPGTSAKDFAVRLEQIKGKQFLEAFQMLKGGGQITQIEGDKAQAAIARMDRAQSEGEFLKALDDFESAVKVGVQKLGQKAGQAPTQSAPQPTVRRRFNPATGKIE